MVWNSCGEPLGKIILGRKVFYLGEFRKKKGFFFILFFPYKSNSNKIKLSNLQEQNVCYA